MLAVAIKGEVSACIAQGERLQEDHGNHRLVWNVWLSGRSSLLGVSQIESELVQNRDRRLSERRKNCLSKIRAPYQCKAESIWELLPLFGRSGHVSNDPPRALLHTCYLRQSAELSDLSCTRISDPSQIKTRRSLSSTCSNVFSRSEGDGAPDRVVEISQVIQKSVPRRIHSSRGRYLTHQIEA